jgi:hypothetical protein
MRDESTFVIDLAGLMWPVVMKWGRLKRSNPILQGPHCLKYHFAQLSAKGFEIKVLATHVQPP